MVLDFFLQAITENPWTIFNSVLLIFTAYMSYTAFKFQYRASIRESLEQLDPADLGRQDKLVPMLHSFDFHVIRDSIAVVKLRSYVMAREPAAASRADVDFLFYMIHRATRDSDGPDLNRTQIEGALVTKVREIDGVDGVWIDGNGMYLEFRTRNAVEIRERTEEVIGSIAQWYSKNAEHLVDNLDIELE